jgi:erythronate-4-phosphate dehydrogenase
MKIVADENIPLLMPLFESIGEVQTCAGRQMNADIVKDADILLVRSVTKVTRHLLEGSRVRFVGTATIGLDHIDVDYLKEAGIAFANAPACNANSVVEYVLSCLSFMSEYYQFKLEERSVGIIGHGNVGSLLAKRLVKLGVKVKLNDPPRAKEDNETEYVSLDEALACDIISLHVPLVKDGDYPTLKLLGASVLEKITDRQILINTSRGEVIDEAALLQKLMASPAFPVVLDVWENEPQINTDLLERVTIGTPHIAGYSLDGKANGTEMIYQALCRFLGFPVRHKAAQFLAEAPLSKLAFTGQADPSWLINTAIRACYDVRSDHWRLRSALASAEDVGAEFDRLRREYPVRREFQNTKIQLKNLNSEVFNRVKNLGFRMKI